MKRIQYLFLFTTLLLTNSWATNLSHLKNFETGKSPEFSNGDVVVIDFLAPWCKSCLKESPKVQTIVEDLDRNDVKFLAVNIDQSNQKRTTKFLKRSGLNELWQDNAGGLYESLAANAGVPFIALARITKDPTTAQILSTWTGHVEKQELINSITALK